jgi:feruloyl esterase
VRTLVAASLIAYVVQQGGAQQDGAKGAAKGKLGAAPPLGATPKPAIPNAKPARTCESLATVALPNTTIESAAVDPNNPGVCRVSAFTTHPPTGDRVRIWVAIPTANWNGRFMGTGGGGFSGGSAGGVNPPLALGYAAGATNTGHEGGSGSFALDANGRLNWQLIRDNGHVGIHEMTVTGKALTQALYGVAPRYSYFNGCSTGGRQGLMEAQRYPEDYNGIVAGAPAINWQKLHPQQMWGAVVMNAMGNPVAGCKLTAATAAAVAACDGIDGVKDGVIEDPARCTYDPKALIGASAGDCGDFTQADADVIRMLWEGPRREDGAFLWYGLPRGADLNALWSSRGNPLRAQAFGISLEWFRYFLSQNPQLDPATITPAAYERYWDQSVEQFTAVIGTDNPDLSAFRDRGGKAIVWHGWADQLISAQGTVDYYKRVQQQMGGADKASQFIRLFMAPGIGHCGGGPGATPSGQLDALLSWVEDGKAPATLPAARRDQTGNITRSRILCPYPMVPKYKGSRSTDDAADFSCSTGF